MRIFAFLSVLMAMASTASAGDFLEWLTANVDRNVLVGAGLVGPSQYDQGQMKLAATVNATGFYHASESLSFGGAGVAIRSTYNARYLFTKDHNFDEFGLAIPFVTYHRGRKVAQVGVEIQRANLEKNFYYFTVGIGWKRKAREPEALASSE